MNPLAQDEYGEALAHVEELEGQREDLETAIRETIEYTRSRKAFGRAVLDNQVVHFTLAELQTELEAMQSA